MGIDKECYYLIEPWLLFYICWTKSKNDSSSKYSRFMRWEKHDSVGHDNFRLYCWIVYINTLGIISEWNDFFFLVTHSLKKNRGKYLRPTRAWRAVSGRISSTFDKVCWIYNFLYKQFKSILVLEIFPMVIWCLTLRNAK